LPLLLKNPPENLIFQVGSQIVLGFWPATALN
jgi:hypothetical protein